MVTTDAITKKKEKVGCIFLEYISGETLSRINISGLTSKEKFKIIKQLLNAIETAHYNGIIHRDINPNNIMIDDNGDVKVIDFGICKIKQMVNSATVFRMGTNLYSAPEVHVHSQNATEQSDLYSIGAVIYYLFAGEQPPLPNCFQDTIDQASGFDVSLKPIVKKLVAENPNERYKDISELKGELTGLLERFLDVNYTAVLTIDHDKFVMLKTLNLIPRNSTIADLKSILPSNFLELYICQEGGVSEILRRINALVEHLECKKLQSRNFFSALIELGVLNEIAVAEGRTARRPTDFGLSLGVILEPKTRPDGTNYVSVLYQKPAQQFIIDNIDAIIDINNAKVCEPTLKKKQNRARAPMQGSAWTDEQERLLVAMFRYGEPTAKIAEKLQRTTGGIAAKLHKLGLIENRNNLK